MSNVGRNIGADIPKIGMRWDINKNGKATRKCEYYDRHSYFYDSLYKFLYGHIGKNFDETFSKFCKRYPKVVERYNTRAEFLDKFRNPETERVYSCDFYVDGNGNIQSGNQYHKPRKQVTVYHDDKPSKIVIRPNIILLNRSSAIKQYIYRSLGKDAYDEIMSGREIELKRFEGFINSTCCYNFNHKIAELARTHLHLMPRITFCGDETIFNLLFPKHEYRKCDILMEGTTEYIKYKAEEKDRKNKEEREKKKLNEETISTLLWSIEDKRKADELAKNIINRDRHGFDDESFKGEFYHGQKRKKKLQ